MKEIIYIAKCGCRVPLEGTIRKKGYSRSCKEHGEKVLRAERECLDCKIIIPLLNTGKGPFRCEEHHRTHNSKKRHEFYLRAGGRIGLQKRQARKFTIHRRGDYCSLMVSCFNSKTKPACDGCLEYVPIFKGVDPERLGYWK